MQTNNTAKKPLTAKTTELAHNIRQRALASLGRLFKCSAAKAEERMQRPASKYNGYRVAFANIVDAGITDVFSRIDAGTVPITIKPAHWSAVDGTDSERAFIAMMATGAGLRPGSLVSYWMPNSTSGEAA
ncbi:hypothetical protein PQR39_35460 [Paraburkholderia sediminicola]|uniref:hypothetical protein n=1 Tax=Paraburkholderia sediminicola TaxID=458836 RepID=UPI0038B82A1F